jgi:predicted enzyme related to lactoylglutathione lyase
MGRQATASKEEAMPVRSDFAPGEFCWIDLSAHDMGAAADWYGTLFGWTHKVVETPGGGPPYAFFQKGDDVVAGIGQMPDEMQTQGIPPMWNSYIATKNCAAMEAKVKEIGGTVTVPTMEVPGHGKLAFFLDPEGASFAAWEAAAGGPGVLVGDPDTLSWNELMSRDSKQASEFYAKLVGWEFAAMPMEGIDYTMIKNDGKDAGGIMPMAGEQFEGIPPHWLVYFNVVDCDATAAKAAETGGQVRVPPTEIPVGKFAVLGDPQGGGFGIITLSPPTS